jgi:hypothetical protein
MNGKYCVLAVGAAMLPMLAGATIAAAQSADALKPSVKAAYEASATIETGTPGIRTFALPPRGFDPLAASDEQLAHFGFPPRPDAKTAPDANARWVRAMSAAKNRVTRPMVSSAVRRMPPVSNLPMRTRPDGIRASVDGTPATGSSYNWSGIVNTSKATHYSSKDNSNSYYYVVSEFNVPVAQQAFASGGGTICDGGYDIASVWNGIDGFNNGDVLQGGTESYAYCNGGDAFTGYVAWVEWYPSYAEIPEFDVNPGDDFFVETWNTSSTNGYVWIEDLTTQTSGTYNLVPTEKPYLVGNSAEYVVERPCCSGGNFYPLVNYVADFWAFNYAQTFKEYFETGKTDYPGSSSSATWLLSMLDDAGDQSISVPTSTGNESIYFNDENCAYSGGCTP